MKSFGKISGIGWGSIILSIIIFIITKFFGAEIYLRILRGLFFFILFVIFWMILYTIHAFFYIKYNSKVTKEQKDLFYKGMKSFPYRFMWTILYFLIPVLQYTYIVYNLTYLKIFYWAPFWSPFFFIILEYLVERYERKIGSPIVQYHST